MKGSSSNRLILGIEFGSTRIKAVLCDEKGKVLAQGGYGWENRLLPGGVWSYRMSDAVKGMQSAYAELKKNYRGRIAALSNGEFRWLLRLETVAASDNSVTTIEYVWGKDISGSLGGAAGIGGLLYTKINGVIYVPQYDAYGNIIGYCDATGSVVATYTYDAFGRTIAQSGSLADVFAFRYSTKYFDRETGFYYYGKRYYSPALRRWLTRDPIGEEGGVNLYGFCENRPIHFHDEIGCIAVKYVAWQDNGWFVKLFSGEAMSLIEVSSAEEIPIVIKTLNLTELFL